MIKQLVALMFCLVGVQVVWAQNLTYDEQQTLAVDELLRNQDGNAYTYVLTDTIVDGTGQLALGMHTVQFTLELDSPFAVVLDINGEQVVNPGETYTWQQNLSLSSSRLYFTFYPATSAVVGEARYQLNIPSISSHQCPQGLAAKNGLCERVTLQASTYQCPVAYTINLEQCERSQTIDITAFCPDDSELVDGKCQVSYSIEPNLTCAAGTVMQNGECVQRTTEPFQYDCEQGFYIDSDRCKQEYTSDSQRSCDSPYAFNDNQCERIVTRGASSCQTGYALDNGQCYQYRDAQDVCPDTFTLINGRCEHMERVDSSVTCQPGYTLSAEGQCIERADKPRNGISCPEGTIWLNNGCQRYVKEDLNPPCSPPYQFNGAFCELTNKSDLTGCPAGWFFIDGRCHQSGSYEFICPPSHTFRDNACVKVDTFPESGLCPENFVRNGDKCQRTISLPPVEGCTQGYAKNGNLCQRTLSQNVAQCQAGYQLLDNQCFALSSIITSCTEGYTLSNGTCTSTDSLAVTEVCPETFERNGNICEKTTSREAVQRCDAGFSFVEGRCQLINTSKFTACETGFELVNGECYQVKASDFTCLDEAQLMPGNVCHKPVISDHTEVCPDSYKNIGHTCQYIDTYAPTKFCELGFEIDDELCKAFFAEEAIACEPGYTLHNDTCYANSGQTQSCEEGYTLANGVCSREVSDNISGCQANDYFTGTACLNMEDFVPRCAAGFEEKTDIDGNLFCEKSLLFKQCPDGFTYSNNGSHQCLDASLNAATLADYCPEGTLFDSDTGQCSGSNVLREASVKCPRGYTKSGDNTCTTDVEHERGQYFVCPSTHYHDGQGNCFALADKVVSCERLKDRGLGEVSSNDIIRSFYEPGLGQCVVEFEFEPQDVYACPQGFTSTRKPNGETRFDFLNGVSFEVHSALGGQNSQRDVFLRNSHFVQSNVQELVSQYACISTFATEYRPELKDGITTDELRSGMAYGEGVFDRTVNQDIAARNSLQFLVGYESDGTTPIFNQFVASMANATVTDQKRALTDSSLLPYEMLLFDAQTNFADLDNLRAQHSLAVNYAALGDEVKELTAVYAYPTGAGADDTRASVMSIMLLEKVGNEKVIKHLESENNWAGAIGVKMCSAGAMNESLYSEWHGKQYESLRALGAEYVAISGAVQDDIERCFARFAVENYDGILNCPTGTQEQGGYCRQQISEDVGTCDNTAGLNLSFDDSSGRCIETLTYEPQESDIVCDVGYSPVLRNGQYYCQGDGIGIPELCLGSESGINNEFDLCRSIERASVEKSCASGDASLVRNDIQYSSINSPGQCDLSKGIILDGDYFCFTDAGQRVELLPELAADIPNGWKQLGEPVISTVYNTINLSQVKNQITQRQFNAASGIGLCRAGGVFAGASGSYTCEDVAGQQIDLMLQLRNQSPDRFELIDGSCNVSVGDGTVTCSYEKVAFESAHCTADVVASEAIFCPAGSHYDGAGNCTRTITVLPENSCDAGEAISGQCANIDSTPAPQHRVCEAGQVLNPGSFQCERVEFNPIQYRCDVGDTYSFNAQTKECEDIRYVDIDNTCPAPLSFVEATNQCEGVIVTDSIESCDAGFVTHNNGNCIAEQRDLTNSICPVNYVYNADKDICEEIIKRNIQYLCETGETLVSRECETYSTASLIIDCPTGYTRSGNACSRTHNVEPVTSCTPDHNPLNASSCHSVFPQSSAAVCPSGWSYNSVTTKCERIETTPLILACDDPMEYDLVDNNSCQKTIYHDIHYQCSNNYVKVGLDRCERLILLEASQSCPSGYQFDNTQRRCERLTTAVPGGCAQGYVMVGNKCYPYEQEAHSCGFGTQRNGDRCERKDVHIPERRCPTNYENDGQECINLITSTASRTCQGGYSLVNGWCRRNVYTSISQCPSQWVLQSGSCRRSTLVDHRCNSPSTLSGNTCRRHDNPTATPQCRSGYVYDSWYDQCTDIDTQAMTESCPSDYSLSSGQCVKNFSTNVDRTCASGQEERGSSCVDTRFANSLTSCSAGYQNRSGGCMRVLTNGATAVCPSGFSRSGSSCVRTESFALSGRCLSGHTDTGSNCARRETYPAKPTCQSGFVDTGSGCQRVTIVDATPSCPTGHTDTGGACRRIETSSATVTCPTGFSNNGSRCVFSQQTQTTHSCPAGWRENGHGQCTSGAIQRAKPTYTCASGSLVKNTCRVKVQVEPTRSCRTGTRTNIYNTNIPGRFPSWNGAVPQNLENEVCISYGGSFSRRFYNSCPADVAEAKTLVDWEYSNAATSYTQTMNLNGQTHERCPMGWNVSSSSGGPGNYNLVCSRPGDHQIICTGSPITFEEVTLTCPTNYVLEQSLVNGRYMCATYNNVPPASTTCASGYALQNDMCIRDTRTTIGQTLTCDSGSISGSRCVEQITKNHILTCPAGMERSGNTCSKETWQPRTWSCPSGYSKVANMCNRTENAGYSYQCRSGFSVSGSSCFRDYSFPFSGTCPSGYNDTGSNCTRSLTQPANEVCPDGYTKINSTTCQRINLHYTNQCHSGYTNISGNCHRTRDLNQSCPSPYFPDGNRCSYGTCPIGYEDRWGSCAKDESRDAFGSCAGHTGTSIFEWADCYDLHPDSPYRFYYYAIDDSDCPSGWSASPGGRCVRWTTYSSYRCPPGYDQDGRQCTRTVYTGAQIHYEDYVTSCPSGYYQSGSRCIRHSTSNSAGKVCPSGYSWSSGYHACFQTLNVNLSYACPDGMSLSGTSCNYHDEQAYSQSCPSGFSPSGNNCLRTISLVLNYQCSDGYNLSGVTCSKTEQSAHAHRCPSGFQMDSSGLFCSTTTTSSLGSECPSGWSLSGNNCVDSHSFRANKNCPAQFVFDGSSCKRERYEVETFFCPSGYTLDRTTCERVVQTTANNVCSGGSANGQNCVKSSPTPTVGGCSGNAATHGNQCREEQDDPSVRSCSAGYKLVNGSCFAIQEKSESCASGYVRDGEHCERLISQAAAVQCPSHMTQTGGDCRRTFVAKFADCNAGYTMSSDGSGQCHRVLPATPTCVNGFDFTGSECEQRESISASYVCPTGFVSTGANSCERYYFYDRFLGCPASHPEEYIYDRRLCSNGPTTTAKVELCPTNTIWDASLSQCRETKSATKVYQCPTDHYRVGATCYRELDANPTAIVSCPAGFTPQFGKEVVCVSTTPDNTQGICPASYVKRAVDCAKTYSEPLTYLCPATYDRVGTQCFRTLFDEIQVSCASGFTPLDDKYCIATRTDDEHRRNLDQVCGTGEQRYGSVCYRYQKAALNDVCASGYVEHQDQCRRLAQTGVNDSCPVGTTAYSQNECRSVTQGMEAGVCQGRFIDGSDGNCHLTELSLGTLNCGSGETLRGNQCWTIENIAAVPACPEDYTLNGGHCRRTVSLPVNKQCANQFGVYDENFCRELAPTFDVGNCPAGYGLESGSAICLQRQTQSRNASCPAQYTYNQRNQSCWRYEDVAPDPYHQVVCSDGYQYDQARNQCWRYEEASTGSNWSCPTNYSYDRGKCVYIPTIAASWACPQGTSTLSESDKTCTYVAKEAFDGSCPAGFTYTNVARACQSDVVIAMEPACNGGGTLQGNGQCQQTPRYAEPTRICPAGFQDHEDYVNCVRVVTEAIRPTCDAGFVYYKHLDQCVDENIHNTLLTCNTPFTLTSDEKLCERLVSQPTTQICADGFTQISATVCQSNNATNEAANCATDYTYHFGNTQCERLLTTAITHTCPPGEILDVFNNTCVLSADNPASKICPPSFALSADGQICERFQTQAAELQCPLNYNRIGDQCERMLEVDAICPTSFAEDGQECTKIYVEDYIPVCEVGQTLTTEGCEQVKFKPPTSCKAGYLLLNGACFKEQRSVYNCPDSYSLSLNSQGDYSCQWTTQTRRTLLCSFGQPNFSLGFCVDREAPTVKLSDFTCSSLDSPLGNVSPGQWITGTTNCQHSDVISGSDYRVQCPTGYYEHDAQQCVSVNSDVNAINCGPGYDYDYQSGYCRSVTTAEPSKGCFDGFEDVGTHCELTLSMDRSPAQCPQGFTRVSATSCYQMHSIPATLSCEEGYSLVDLNTCEKREVAPLIWEP